ncbi:MAG: ATP-binding cassette domain-containing protein, partial [Mesorhizobium sp.]
MAETKALHVRGLVIAPGVDPMSQTIAPGEIVGLAGLDGHGQERFLRALAGLDTPVAGEIAVEGRAGSITSFRKP